MRYFLIIVFSIFYFIGISQNIILPDSLIESYITADSVRISGNKHYFYYDEGNNIVRNELYVYDNFNNKWYLYTYVEYLYENDLLQYENDYAGSSICNDIVLYSSKIYHYINNTLRAKTIAHANYDDNCKVGFNIQFYEYDTLVNVSSKREFYANDSIPSIDSIKAESYKKGIGDFKEEKYYYSNNRIDSVIYYRPYSALDTTYVHPYYKEYYTYEEDTLIEKVAKKISGFEGSWLNYTLERYKLLNGKVSQSELYSWSYPTWIEDEIREYEYEDDNLLEFRRFQGKIIERKTYS